MVNTPIPHSLRAESRKAAKILQDFTMPSAKTGPDKIIPAGLLVKAEGLAILTVVKVGFLVTARAGSGIVIAKLGNRKWSAPSAIGIAGLGGGFEIGAEVTDFVIILTTKSALDAFSKGGNLTLGGNFTIAAGPLGRNVEGDVSLRSPAAIYTYSKTKGLFAGISIEGSYLIERKEANKKFYGSDLRAYEILSENLDVGSQCKELYEILAHHEEMFERVIEAKTRQAAATGASMATAHVQRSYRDGSLRSSFFGSSRTRNGNRSPDDGHDPYSSSSYKGSWTDENEKSVKSRPRSGSMSISTKPSRPPPKSATSDDLILTSRTQSARHTSSKLHVSSSGAIPKKESQFANQTDWDTPPRCKALWQYKAEMPCDLTFSPGDIIEILTRTHTQDDWWEGIGVDGKVGIFPANYVQLL